jgi:LemA protein
LSIGVATLGLLTFILLGVFVVYYRLAKCSVAVEQGWSGIDDQLKWRVNLVPVLVETFNDYSVRERDNLKVLTDMSARVKVPQGRAQRVENEGLLSAALGRIFVVADNYSELKASPVCGDLQSQLFEIEDHIQVTRPIYNGAVRNLNIMVSTFPGNLAAKVFGFGTADFFEIEDAYYRPVPEIDN